MKRFVLMIVPALICGMVLTSCSLVNESEFTGKLWLKMGDGTILSTSDIDFYNMSMHRIYLKEKLPYLEKIHGTMSVYVNGIEIYECVFHSVICSHMPSGVYAFVGTSTITVCFSPSSMDSKDPRSDERIIAVLKKKHLYHEGLRCEIQSVNYSNGELVLNIELSNPDTFDYYYLDPDKMGIGLFHYYTNGPTFLTFLNDQYQRYNHRETVIHPEETNPRKNEWLTLIKNGERKNISITYHNFDNIPVGNYKIYFSFPGYFLSKDRKLGSDMIGMVNINMEKDITIQ